MPLLLETTLDDGVGIGVSSFASGGTAHAVVTTGQQHIADAPDSPALEDLRALFHHHQWRNGGSPRTHELHGHLHRDGDVWNARVFDDSPQTVAPPNDDGRRRRCAKAPARHFTLVR
ncbi:hypothetical protein [Streptomyces jeddahensis]|uniref:Uncharacterized protein n=1 Tax=Streptomyces jeddahensis TaxID=1716141 RepID=A0A177HGW3_9ACTN|nr:hypothetical protein [Streptomyces jeddahensis]OAH10212.1 hypothetical protein STSP_64680 [Streptomyces jeddahensis]